MSEAIYGIVYKVTNLIDGKVYIGQTIQTLWRRRRAHENLSAKPSTYFHRALAKHGFGNFSWEIVDTCASKESLHAREQHWIDHCACMAPAGYNSAEGGKGGAYLESHKQRISESMRGRPRSEQAKLKQSLAMKGRKASPETIAKFRARTAEKNPFFGKVHTEETRKIIGEKSNGRNWATGERAAGWSNADRRVILECYFEKRTNKEIMAIHLTKTGRIVNIGAIFRVCRELGLFISESRGRRGLRERHQFIDASDINVFYERLKNFNQPSPEFGACSDQTSDAIPERLALHSGSTPCNL